LRNGQIWVQHIGEPQVSVDSPESIQQFAKVTTDASLGGPRVLECLGIDEDS
jgi:hypothetical protein